MPFPEPISQGTVDPGAIRPQNGLAAADPTRRKGPVRVLTPNPAMDVPSSPWRTWAVV